MQIRYGATRIISPFDDYNRKFGTDAFWHLYAHEPLDTSTGNLNLNNQIIGDVGVGTNYFAQRVGLGDGTGVIFRVTNVRPTDIIIPTKGKKKVQGAAAV